jgi:AAA domain
MPASRPYFSKNIAELEALYSVSEQNHLVLVELQTELRIRTTNRAAILLARVDSGLASLLGSSTATAVQTTMAVPKVRVEDKREAVVSPSLTQHTKIADPAPLPLLADEFVPHDVGETPQSFSANSIFVSPIENNEPLAIMAAWTALEALSPQTYRRPEDLAFGDRSCVADLSRGELPWLVSQTSRRNYQLYFQIVLGSIPMDLATDGLIRAFGADEERGRGQNEKACIAAVLVDRKGILLEADAIGISSFAWALPLALQRQLGALGAWPTVEKKLVGELEKQLRRYDENGVALSIDGKVIDDAYKWLVKQLCLPTSLVEVPSFALKVFHYYKAKSPPDVTLLNSFFLADLARATELCRAQKMGIALRRYIGAESPTNIVNLLADLNALESVIAPAMQPASRWPSPGGHPLVTLQQAAVDIARHELTEKEGIVSVNGPPGTGKTTLLRDIVAACVLDRALAMTKFDAPETAFKASGQKVKAGDTAFFHIYELDKSLRGHEVLVASSNNKAVENVSRELPALKAIGRTVDELAYFRTASDQLLVSSDDKKDDLLASEAVETWGLIAAVLGNAKNRSEFQKNLWWDTNNALRLYLKAAKGDSVVRETTDAAGNIQREIPTIISKESPPSAAEAKVNWLKAKRRLLEIHKEIDSELKLLEQLRQICLQLNAARKALPINEAKHMSAVSELEAARQEANALQIPFSQFSAKHQLAEGIVKELLKTKPGFLFRLFRTKRWAAWLGAYEPAYDDEQDKLKQLLVATKHVEQAEQKVKSLAKVLDAAEKSLAEIQQKIATLAKSVDTHRKTLGDRIVDEAFFKRGHKAWNLESPWLPDSLHKKREDLFIASMAVHKAFIDSSAQKVLHNLSVLMDAMTSGSFQDATKRALLGDLWSTLFLVIPVVSTTFASVDRMLGDLPADSIGWLLIDEAGQALPQAAVGAVMRAKRAIVVGDPLQIPPVVSLPERLNSEICAFFKVTPETWSAPKASAQTIADQASRFKSAFRSDQGPRYVGVPLLVHRRCQEPMFSVSNRIAYDGQMVHAPSTKEVGRVGQVLGISGWLNIDDKADTKWCPSEGELVVSMLKNIAMAGVTNPDIYVITPFRIVAYELRNRLEREPALFSAFGVQPKEWLKDRVGTIHTFQGKEAETVIVVLGAPNASQHGARSWAAGSPNLLNVMVSRAKQNLYVVGSHGAWSGVGYCRELARMLPIFEAR